MPVLSEDVEDIITTDLDFEHMLSHLLSKARFHGASGHLPPPAWKRQIIHIFKTLEKAARETLNGDEFHRREIEKHCRKAVADLNKLTSTDEISIAAIKNLTYVSFLLIGEWPNNWDKTKSSAAHPQNWKLTRYRTLHYLQSPAQKFRQIIDSAEREEFRNRMPSTDELLKRFNRECKSDMKAFIQWFKREHMEIYIELE